MRQVTVDPEARLAHVDPGVCSATSTRPPRPTGWPPCSGSCPTPAWPGVVTRFSFRLHPVGPTVTGGLIVWSADRAAEVLAAYRDLTEQAPRELTAAVTVRLAPPAPFLPNSGTASRLPG
jgi:hypothetical protein